MLIMYSTASNHLQLQMMKQHTCTQSNQCNLHAHKLLMLHTCHHAAEQAGRCAACLNLLHVLHESQQTCMSIYACCVACL